MAFCVLLSQNKKLKIDAFGYGFETFQDVQQKKAPEMVREELLHSLTESEGEGKPELLSNRIWRWGQTGAGWGGLNHERSQRSHRIYKAVLRSKNAE